MSNACPVFLPDGTETTIRKERNLFLGVTGSVAARLVGKMIDRAHRSGFDSVTFHPSDAALPFLVETLAHDYPETAGGDLWNQTSELFRDIERHGECDRQAIGDWIEEIRKSLADRGIGKTHPYRRIVESFENGKESGGMLTRDIGNVRHIEVAERASVALIAPATANTIAKIVNGTTDSFLLQVVRAIDPSGQVPVLVAPAMNTNMLGDPFTCKNLRQLCSEGYPKYQVLPTESKLLQCGKYGDGALLRVDEIFRHVRNALDRTVISED